VPGPGGCPWSFSVGFLLLGLNGAPLLFYEVVTAFISSLSFLQILSPADSDRVYCDDRGYLFSMRLISPLLLPVIDILYQ
jgi:hypothetical protein